MAFDTPDWSKSVGKSIEGEGLQLLAQPPVWWMDDFESPVIRWRAGSGTLALDSTAGTGTDTGVMLFGSAALKITSAAGGTGIASIYVGSLPEESNYGVSTHFKVDDKTKYADRNNSLVPMSLVYNTADYKKTTGIGYNVQDYKWYVWDGTAADWVNFLTYRISVNAYNFVKMIVDPINDAYVSCRINDVIHDLSAYAPQLSTTAATKFTELQVFDYGSAGNQAVLWVDNVKITYGES